VRGAIGRPGLPSMGKQAQTQTVLAATSYGAIPLRVCPLPTNPALFPIQIRPPRLHGAASGVSAPIRSRESPDRPGGGRIVFLAGLPGRRDLTHSQGPTRPSCHVPLRRPFLPARSQATRSKAPRYRTGPRLSIPPGAV